VLYYAVEMCISLLLFNIFCFGEIPCKLNKLQRVPLGILCAPLRSSFFTFLFYRVSEKSGTNGNYIYYLHYMLHMFTPTLHARSQPLYHVCEDLARHIGIDSSTTVCNSLPKVTKISDFNRMHLCLHGSPKCKISTLSCNVNVILSLLTFNFNLQIKIRKVIKIPIGSRRFGQPVD
jgi:hypothetical protein